MRPFWTVLIPTYHRVTYLKQCLDSVLQEDTGPEHMEILVTDDCSPPEVEAAVRQWGRDRVAFRPLKRHQGQWPNVNAGVAAARGQWIHLLNDDDFVLPGFYNTMEAAIAQAPGSVGVISSPSLLLRQAEGRTGPQVPVQITAGLIQGFLERLVIANPINLASTVVSRDVYSTIGNYTPRLPFCSDWDFHIRSAARFDWWYVPRTLACYRLHDQGVTSQHRRAGSQARDIRSTLQRAQQWLPDSLKQSCLEKARCYHARQFATQAARALEQGDEEAGFELLRQASLFRNLRSKGKGRSERNQAQ